MYIQASGEIDSNIYVYDADSAKLSRYDFETGFSDDQDLDMNHGQLSDLDQSRYDAGVLVSGRHPVDVMWDMGESRLLTCRAKLLHNKKSSVRTISDSDSIVQVENKLAVIIISIILK